jgi:hypothetical protein
MLWANTPFATRQGDIFQMETPSPALFADSAFAAAYFMRETGAAGPAADGQNESNQNEDIDGCDVQAEVLTSDEELPEAEGGVA